MQCFSYVRRANFVVFIEVGNRPRDAKRAMIATRGERPAFGCLQEEAVAIDRQLPVHVQPPPWRASVARHAAERRISCALNLARRIDP